MSDPRGKKDTGTTFGYQLTSTERLVVTVLVGEVGNIFKTDQLDFYASSTKVPTELLNDPPLVTSDQIRIT